MTHTHHAILRDNRFLSVRRIDDRVRYRSVNGFFLERVQASVHIGEVHLHEPGVDVDVFDVVWIFIPRRLREKSVAVVKQLDRRIKGNTAGNISKFVMIVSTRRTHSVDARRRLQRTWR